MGVQRSGSRIDEVTDEPRIASAGIEALCASVEGAPLKTLGPKTVTVLDRAMPVNASCWHNL
jgi:hypothetical protein